MLDRVVIRKLKTLECVYLSAREEDADLAKLPARRAGVRVHRVATLEELLERMEELCAEIVIADRVWVERGNWETALRALENRHPDVIFIVASEICDAALWAEVILRGGFEVVRKPFQEGELMVALEAARRFSTLIAPSAVAARHDALMDAIRKDPEELPPIGSIE